MTTTSEKIYIEGTYLENNPDWHAADAPWKAQNIAKILYQHSLTPASVCEVGCGSGEVLAQLLPYFRNAKYFGYEISPQAFEICQTKANKQLQFFLADLTQAEGAFFDLLLAIDVFEHVEDYLGFLRKLKAKSKYQIFHIPLDMSVSSVLRSQPILTARERVGHLHYFSKETAIATLRHAGLQIIDSFYTAGSIDIGEKSAKTKLANVPRKFLYALNPDLSVRVLGGYSLMVLTASEEKSTI